MLHHDSQQYEASLAQWRLTLIWDNLGFLSYGIKRFRFGDSSSCVIVLRALVFKSGVEDSNFLSRLSN